MSGVGKTRLFRDIPETSATEVLEQDIAHLHGRHKEIGITVIIDVRKRCRHMDASLQTNTCFRGNILEAAVPQISPELIGPELVDEVNVQESVTVHIGHGEPVPMVVMNRFPPF